MGPGAEAHPASPPATAAMPQCRRRSRPHQDMMHVLSVHFKCFRCFRGMFQVFNTDVAKVDRGCCICCNGCTHMLQASVLNVSSIFHMYVASVFIWMLYMFHTYGASVLSRCCVCFQWFSITFASVSDACFKCFIFHFCMLHMLH
jgi:hypothetical protein